MSEIESLKKAHDEAISRIQESEVAEVTKLTERVVVLEEAIKSKHRRSLDYPDGYSGEGYWMIRIQSSRCPEEENAGYVPFYRPQALDDRPNLFFIAL